MPSPGTGEAGLGKGTKVSGRKEAISTSLAPCKVQVLSHLPPWACSAALWQLRSTSLPVFMGKSLASLTSVFSLRNKGTRGYIKQNWIWTGFLEVPGIICNISGVLLSIFQGLTVHCLPLIFKEVSEPKHRVLEEMLCKCPSWWWRQSCQTWCICQLSQSQHWGCKDRWWTLGSEVPYTLPTLNVLTK